MWALRYASRSSSIECAVVGTSFCRTASSAACTLHASMAGICAAALIAAAKGVHIFEKKKYKMSEGPTN